MNSKAYLTAITRKKLSQPAQFLVNNQMIRGLVLDYGCGKGFDADVIGAVKFDPHFYSMGLNHSLKFDTIMCNYVLNVVDEQTELQILDEIKERLAPNGKAYISVRRDKFQEGYNSRGTFQRYSYPKLKSIQRTSNFEMYVLEA